jgi:hypothetical protein
LHSFITYLLDKRTLPPYIHSTRLEDRLLHPRRYVVPITFELLTDPNLEATAKIVWGVMATIATDGSAATDQREFISPGHERMAQLCNCTINTLRDAYKSLAGFRRVKSSDDPDGPSVGAWIKDAGRREWIKELPNLNGYPVHYSIVVPNPAIVWEERRLEVQLPNESDALHNMYSPIATTMSQSTPPPKVTPPQFPTELIRLAESVSLKDHEGAHYTLPSMMTLWTYSGHAGTDDLRRGLLRLKEYMDKDAPVSSVRSLFLTMFREGRFVVRKRILGTRNASPAKDLPDSTRKEWWQAASELARGVTIEIGRLDPKLRMMLLEKEAVQLQGPRATLKPTFDLTFDLASATFTIAVITPDGNEEHVPAEVQE